MHTESTAELMIKNAATSINDIIQQEQKNYSLQVKNAINTAWQKIAPCWPLKNFIAVNPLQGFEDLPFEQALNESAAFFQQAELPAPFNMINKDTIKWCQAFFDAGQSTISMPLRHLGFYTAWRQLVIFDDQLIKSNNNHRKLLIDLPHCAEQAIANYLIKLNIPVEQTTTFLTLLLTTLPGWAGYIKYYTDWQLKQNANTYPVTAAEYLAIRLIITYLRWPNASELLTWHGKIKNANTLANEQLTKIISIEKNYRQNLLNNLVGQNKLASINKETPPQAQFIFCIDVRSEPMRYAIETQGNYETFGFAGFFGLPINIVKPDSNEIYAACPVLLKPQHTIKESLLGTIKQIKQYKKGQMRIAACKRFYQSLKYNFTTPFVLVEALGVWNGLWSLLKTIAPKQSKYLKQLILSFLRPSLPIASTLTEQSEINDITFTEQCTYAENFLTMLNLTNRFAPIIVLCGHGSKTENNAYASALDCGACGGHAGDGNARTLASILNNSAVRQYLADRNIYIPATTRFIAGLHNTTTDELILFKNEINNANISEKLKKLRVDLAQARKINNAWRLTQLDNKKFENNIIAKIYKRSVDWAQTRPEWGLARNAAFIVAPRYLTKNIKLNGRAFLHSYDWQADPTGSTLTTILTAPMVVAQWINNQYLFSTLDNVAYGSGSKITHNITGKIGVMQGNASDLMHGLPLQSIYSSDTETYHQPVRLLTFVHAPRTLIGEIIAKQTVLQKLFGNGWVNLICLDSADNFTYELTRELSWQKIKI